jgi:hypothetical protein
MLMVSWGQQGALLVKENRCRIQEDLQVGVAL